jgi:hypothetical protein
VAKWTAYLISDAEMHFGSNLTGYFAGWRRSSLAPCQTPKSRRHLDIAMYFRVQNSHRNSIKEVRVQDFIVE